MHIDQLIIEVTRKCNLKCQHCLRGNAQRRNIDPEIIGKFLDLNNVRSVNSLTFTGGEPLLNPKGINDIVDIFLNWGTDLSMFYMVTNGTVSPIPVIISLSKLSEVVNDPEYFRIDISQDEYHEYEGNISHPAWNLIQHGAKEGPDYESIIAEGRGKDLNPDGRKIAEYGWVWDDENPDRMEEGTVYINALGMICKDCDYSYKTQQDKNVGHCLSKPLKEF